jgi:hypothetical protein
MSAIVPNEPSPAPQAPIVAQATTAPAAEKANTEDHTDEIGAPIESGEATE